MTDQNHTKKSKNNRVYLFCFLTVILLIGVWIAYFIISFDLNDYRRHAEQRLASILSLPVALGEMEYNFHGSRLALEITGIQIGDKNTPVEVNAPKLLVDLQWSGLLQRDFRFSTISLFRPYVRLSRVMKGTTTDEESLKAAPPPVLIDQALLHNLSIEALEINEGILNLDLVSQRQQKITIEVNNIQGKVNNLQRDRRSTIALEGNLIFPEQKQPTQLRLQGKTSLIINDGQRGWAPTYDLDLACKSLDLDAIGASFINLQEGTSLSGKTDVDIILKSSQLDHTNFQVKLNSENINITPNSSYSSPIKLNNILASGQYKFDNDKHNIKNLSLQVDKSRLSGQLKWTKTDVPFKLSASLANGKLTVTQIKQWIPTLEGTWATINDRLSGQGTVLIEKANLSYTTDSESSGHFDIQQLTGEIHDVTWAFPRAPELTITSLPISFINNSWQLGESSLQFGSTELVAHGQGVYQSGHLNVTSLDYSGKLMPQRLIKEWYFPQSALTSDGEISFDGHIEGPQDKLAIDLQANLSNLSLNHPAGLTLTPDIKDNLTIHATVTPGRISLDHGSIKWSAAKGHINGSYLTGNPESLQLDALLTIEDLSRVAESLPILEKLKLNGQADLSIRQRGNRETNRPEMILTLRDAGMKTTRYIADLKNINGRITVEPQGLLASDLHVQLGESLLTVDAKLSDFTDPQLSLDVRGPSVKAQDLVFYSPTATLRDIDGHLEINRKGLTFSPVNVRLDGGTDASVRGSIEFTRPYPVNLEVTSEHALISEVIGLWSGRPREKTEDARQDQSGTQRRRHQTPIMITAKVNKGDLYGMKFNNASGVIKPSRKRLIIHPLDFSVGQGYCNAQVITEFQTGGPPVLRLSGHAEDVDALAVYRELLNQKSIVRGKLRGDFYLHGEIGSNYLPSSYGRFNIQVRDGVLHQFPILSKVFSLLNVSQIFALRLPDMDSKGMPFNNLTANLRLDEGILSSDDLVITSEAMNQSYYGQLDLVSKEIDLSMAIHPLGTVDKVVSRIPIAGWLLTGEDKALLTAHFNVTGKTDSVSVQPMPLDTLSEPTIGLLKRTLGLPFKLVDDPQILWGGQSKPKAEEKK